MKEITISNNACSFKAPWHELTFVVYCPIQKHMWKNSPSVNLDNSVSLCRSLARLIQEEERYEKFKFRLFQTTSQPHHYLVLTSCNPKLIQEMTAFVSDDLLHALQMPHFILYRKPLDQCPWGKAAWEQMTELEKNHKLTFQDEEVQTEEELPSYVPKTDFNTWPRIYKLNPKTGQYDKFSGSSDFLKSFQALDG